MAPAAASTPSPRILWDVLEEHLEEGAFGMLGFARALESPIRTLRDLARYPEQRMIAHVDGLHCGGAAVRERLLEPAVREPDDEEPERASCAAWALLEQGLFAAVQPLLSSSAARLLDAGRAAARHVRRGELDDWLLQQLRGSTEDERTAGLLALAEARNLPLPGLLRHLQSGDASVVAQAARAARFADSSKMLGIFEQLLDHANGDVRDAALVAGLSWGIQRAWFECKRLALEPAQPCPLATTLYAALGTRADHEPLRELLREPGARRDVLFALGFSGNTALASPLLEQLASDDPVIARIASQALGLIFGFAPADDAFALAPAPRDQRGVLPPPEDDLEASEALPELEQDDLEADLVPAPEEELEAPNVSAIERFCAQQLLLTGTGKRLLHGRAYSSEQVGAVLNAAPLRVRHVVALAHGVRCGGKLWVDTRAASARQRQQIALVASHSPQRHMGF